MEGESLPVQRPNAERRESTEAVLCEHFAAGHMELDELERRLAAVDRAETDAQLDALLEDLPELPHPAPAVTRPPEERGFALAVMGGTSRGGRWTPPRTLYAVGVMGGVELDFRGALLAPGVTQVVAIAVMGGVEITVPPGLEVDLRGIPVMGSVESRADEISADVPSDESGGRPRLRVRAVACMGGVEVKTESRQGDSRTVDSRRSRRERRERRRRR